MSWIYRTNVRTNKVVHFFKSDFNLYSVVILNERVLITPQYYIYAVT